MFNIHVTIEFACNVLSKQLRGKRCISIILPGQLEQPRGMAAPFSQPVCPMTKQCISGDLPSPKLGIAKECEVGDRVRQGDGSELAGGRTWADFQYQQGSQR